MTEFDVETRLEDYFTWLEDATGQPMTPDARADTTTPGSAGGHRRGFLLGAAAACVGLLVGGLVLLAGDDQALSPATVPEPTAAPDTVASTGVKPSPTIVRGTSVPVTTAAVDDNVAVVWTYSVDSNRVNTEQPPPQWVVSETTVALDIVGIVANDPTAGEYGEFCAERVELMDRDDEQCMLVQFRFDVSADATERGGITVPYVITAEGEQIDLFASLTAWGDTDANLLLFAVPGAGPGSKIVFTVNGGLGVADLQQNIEFVTPDADEWKPVDFLGG